MSVFVKLLNQSSSGPRSYYGIGASRPRGVLYSRDATAGKYTGGAQWMLALLHAKQAGGSVLLLCGVFAFQVNGWDLRVPEVCTVFRAFLRVFLDECCVE